MAETKFESVISKAYEAMNKKQFNKALTFFNMAIKALNELTRDEYHQKRLDEIVLMATNCKIEIRNSLLEQVKTFIEHEKIPLILEHYELIIELTHEIGDIENLDKYKQVFGEDVIEDVDFINDNIKTLNLDKSSDILDIGTGYGEMSLLLALNGYTVLTGQPKDDYDPHAHQYGDWEEKARKLGVRNKIRFQHLNAENLDFSDDYMYIVNDRI